MIKIKKFPVNPLQENSYLLSDETGDCILVDPGFYYPNEENRIVNYLEKNSLHPVKIICTHSHFDHIMGIEFLRKRYKIPFECHPEDSFWLRMAPSQAALFGIVMSPVLPADHFFSGEEVCFFGKSRLKTVHIPGHSPGHVVFISEDENFVISGDVLFHGSIGRSDLPGGDHSLLIRGITVKLLSLPPETRVYCGHGSDTTIASEKNNNPFLIQHLQAEKNHFL